MKIDKAFLFTFTLSLTVHTVILLKNPNFQFWRKDEAGKEMKIAYLKEVPERLDYPKPKEEKKERQGLIKLTSKATIKNTVPPPYVENREIIKMKQARVLRDSTFTKPALIKIDMPKPDVISVKKRITLPPIDMGKMNNPSYVSYYQIVREKIKRSAYQNYMRTDIGEVFLSFVITKNGLLKAVNLSDEKSSESIYLREIAMRSIKEASPFPIFPAELEYPELSFNVIISFSVE
jgi:outer membrane biosynthesis protein TonB